MKKLIIIVAVLIASACAKKPVTPVNTAPQYYTHTISSQGETLANIAKWYTGAAANWQTILAYNPGLDVRRMRIGTQVQIPNNMLIRTTTMPRNKGGQAPAVAKTQEVEILQPAQESLANSQVELTAPTETTEAAANVTEEFPAVDNSATETSESVTVTNTDGEEVVIKQLSPEEIAALKAESGEMTDTPQKKSILSKFQEAALKAQEKSLNGDAPANTTTTNTADQVNAAQDQAKAAQDAANAQVKAAQEQAAKAISDAQKQNADAQENSAKTRDDLIKELTQDY